MASSSSSSSSSCKPHALMLPLPETGHINPLMQLAKHLASHGFLITFVNTQYNHNRILQSNRARLPADKGLDIRLVGIPDGLSEHDNRDNDVPIFVKIIENIGPVLEDLIARLDVEGPRVTCIISDVAAVRTLDVAKKLGIPRVGFWPPNASIHALICHASHAASNGSFAEKGVPEPSDIVSFPGMPSLPGSKIPWVVGSKEDAESIFQSITRNVEALRQSEWVLCNSVLELEPTTQDQLPPGFPKVCPVGPILPTNFLDGKCSRDNRVTASLWTEEDTCLEWLDAQKHHSVMYVSVGSIAILNQEQLHELAYGLEATELPILWVVRPDLVGEKRFALPEGFLERTQDRIRIVAWAPQLLVLCHIAVGGFLTHCGWNSTIEGMSMGVPMLAWPHLVDQFLNAELVMGQWGVGIELDVGAKGFVGRAMVEGQVRRLMEGHEGQLVRAKALEIRHVILRATREGGSSYNNLQRFTDWVKQQTEIIHKASKVQTNQASICKTF